MPKPRDTEPHCPARLARFRLELQDVAPDGGSLTARMLAEPQTPLPCIESSERPGRCVHCQQAIESAAGAPHGPYCTGDSRCRECARLQREARAWGGGGGESTTPTVGAPAPELPAALLEEWRSDADRWARFSVMPADETRLATQRIATLIAALLDARAGGELAAALLDKAAELETRVEALRLELSALSEAFARKPLAHAAPHRPPFSSQPVEILSGCGGGGAPFSSTQDSVIRGGGGGGSAPFSSTQDPICSIRSEAIGSPVPCFASHAHPGHVARCTFCDRAMLPPR